MYKDVIQEEVLLGYDRFISKQDLLVSIGEEICDVFDRLAVTDLKNVLLHTKERLRNEHFRLLVIGEFNNGKSTLINALLGEEILPSSPVETTAVINEIKWGPAPAARVHYKDGGCQEVSFTELERYVALPPENNDPREGMKESAYDKVEIFWPLDICRNGVEIIDSPGLNAHELREKITLDYLAFVDAIVFVLDCMHLGGMNELRIIDNLLRPAGYDDIFFVGNKINMLSPKDVDRVKNVAYNRLGPRTKRGPQRVFFVNALGALEGCISKDIEKIEKSGIRKFEQALAEFLTTDRARAKLMRSALELSNSARQARKLVPQQINMLKMDVATFEERERLVEIPLTELEEKRRVLIEHVTARVANVEQDAVASAQLEFQELVNKVKAWASEYKPTNKVSIGLSESKAEAEIEAVSNEIAEFLNEQAEQDFATWQTTVLQPLVQERLIAIIADFAGEIEGIDASVEQLRTEMSVVSISTPEAAPFDKPASTTNRIVSATVGLFLIDVGLAVTGATFGFKQVLRNAIPQLAIVAAGYLLLGPLVAIPALAYSWYRGKTRVEEINVEIKNSVSGHLVEHLANHSSENAKMVGDAVLRNLTRIRDSWDKSFETEIATVRQQLESVRLERQKGEAAVVNKTLELEAVREQMEVVGGKLDDFMAEFAGS